MQQYHIRSIQHIYHIKLQSADFFFFFGNIRREETDATDKLDLKDNVTNYWSLS